MRKVFKWIGIILGSLLGLLVVAYLALYVITEQRLNRTYEVPSEAVVVPSDAASIERGRHLVTTVGFCNECHGPDLGGQVMEDDPIVGRLVAPNLTRGQGGKGAELTDEDFVRAIRHGVDSDGKSLIVMPANVFYALSDKDLGAIIAYLKSVPPVDNELPEITLGPIGRFYVLQYSVPASMIDHTGPRPPAPEPGVTAEYGEYLAFNCRTCHGPAMSGLSEEQGGGSNLTPGGKLSTWTAEDFIQTIRTRVDPSGHEIDPELAPLFTTIGKMSDDELTAIWLYLQSLPPVENTPQPSTGQP